jgi:hypothetical protein
MKRLSGTPRCRFVPLSDACFDFLELALIGPVFTTNIIFHYESIISRCRFRLGGERRLGTEKKIGAKPNGAFLRLVSGRRSLMVARLIL